MISRFQNSKISRSQDFLKSCIPEMLTKFQDSRLNTQNSRIRDFAYRQIPFHNFKISKMKDPLRRPFETSGRERKRRRGLGEERERHQRGTDARGERSRVRQKGRSDA